MLCQKCKINTATNFMKMSINGKVSSLSLCPICASDYSEELQMNEMSSFLKSYFSPISSKPQTCNSCGTTILEIRETGKLGCPDCYKCFYDKILPGIEKIHGKVENRGKRPGKKALMVSEKTELSVKNPVEDKRRLLNKAIKEERFEDAAVLRDEIKKLEE